MNPLDELKVLQDEERQTTPAEIPPVEHVATEAHMPDRTMAMDLHRGDTAFASVADAEELNDAGVDVDAGAGADANEVAPNPCIATVDAHPSSAPLFIIDTAGDKSLRQIYPEISTRTNDESVHNSDSSEEVILFKGRNPSRHTTAPATRSTNTPKPDGGFMQLSQIDTEIKLVEETIQAAPDQAPTTSTDIDVYKAAVTEHPSSEKKVDQRFENLLSGSQSDEEAAMIADYIANMKEDEDDDEDELDQHPGLGSHAFHLLRDIGGIDSDELPERLFDEDSIDESGEQANNSHGPSVRQAGSQSQDERLARMLAKQEQVGLGGDAIFLYDGTGSGDDGGDDWNIAPKTTSRRKKKGSSTTNRIVQKKGQFPSASKMAEAFDELDLMDWHRPSLHNYNKRSQAPYVSDSELEDAMNATFQRDRLKKAEKKKQREALRAQGLLGKNINPEDPRIKYPGGMTKDDIVYELEQFILGDDEQ